MYKKIAFAGLGIALLASPLLASADTLSDLQAQVQALLSQLAALQQQLGSLQNGSQNTPSTTPQPVSANCVVLTSDIGADDTDATTGGDVTRLQKFLTAQYAEFFDKYVTGYFGPMTEAAVKQWQKEHSLVSKGDANSTGWGYIGPKTRAALAQGCGTATVISRPDVQQPVQVPLTPQVQQPSMPVPEPRIACPIALRTACPTGYHYVYGQISYDSTNNCPMQSATCVPDVSTPPTPDWRNSPNIAVGTKDSYAIGQPYDWSVIVTNAPSDANLCATLDSDTTNYEIGVQAFGGQGCFAVSGNSTQHFIGTLDTQGGSFLPGQYHLSLRLIKDTAHYGGTATTYAQRNSVSFAVTDANTSTNQLALVFVAGNASSYTAGQSVRLVMKGIELVDGSAGTPEEGMNIQVYVSDASGNGVGIDGMNANYNYSTGYWEASFTAPSDTSKTYSVRASFYCSNTTRSCASRYANTKFGNGQIDKNFTFNVTNTASSSITASPTFGAAPLAVSFSVSGTNAVSPYVVSFGDGQSWTYCPVGSGICGPNWVASHTYTSPGTYTVTLTQDYACLHTSPRCALAVQVLGTVTVTVLPSIVPQGGITVTAPNGGEQWEMGVLNTVTWTPYNYNPDINPAKDVTAYLERKSDACSVPYGCYDTLGKVEESGKASIHWITGQLYAASQSNNFAPEGPGYYIRVVNNVTGAWDRSDTPFTLLRRPVDISVNGSGGPVSLSDNQLVTVTWSSSGGRNVCDLSGVRETPSGNNYIPNQPASGSRQLYAAVYPGGSSISAACRVGSDYTTSVYDVVAVNPSSTASVQVLSPNGGEQIDPSQPMWIRFAPQGVSMVSVALYKNDQWKYWITKSFIPSGKDVDGISWTPSLALQALGTGDNAGNIFKIYVTGQRSDGTGYVDDKSDAPFSFTSVPQSGTNIAIAFPAGGASFTQGQSFPINWSVTNIPAKGSYQVELVAERLDPSNPGTVVEQWHWQSPMLNEGNSSATHQSNVWNPASYNYPGSMRDFPTGSYRLSAFVMTCNPLGCSTPRTSNGYSSPQLATTGPVTFTVGSPVSSTGTLTVSTDASSPSYQIVAGSATGVVLGVYKLQASGENITLNKLGLTLSSGKPADLNRVYIYAGTTLLGAAVFTGNMTTATSTLQTPVTLVAGGGGTSITIKGDIAGIGLSQAGTSGDLIQVNAANYQATGQNSGMTISGGASTNVAGVRIFRSYPSVALVPLPTTGLEDGRLLRFSVTASPSGSVQLGKLSFNQSCANVSMTGGGLYGFTDAGFSNPIPGRSGGQLGGFPGGCTPSTFNIVPIPPVFTASPVVVPAGQTYYFEMRGTLSGMTNGSAVSTALLGDVASQTGMATGPSAFVSGNFVWSPNTFTTAAYGDSDWTNGSALPGLNSTVSQSRTGSGTVSQAPACSVSTDKASYAYGDTITLTWSTTNATYANWVPDTSGKDNFVLGTDKLGTSGTAKITANVIGNPFVTLKATGPGGTATCTKVIPVSNISAVALYAYPTSGQAPFKVLFTTSGGTPTDSISFGDGATSNGPWSPDAEANTLFMAHTYTTGGVYVAQVTSLTSKASAKVTVTSTTPPPPASCSFSGVTVANGQTVTAYQASSVAYGSQCTSETRTCTNGTLSGSNQYASCTVASQTTNTSCTYSPTGGRASTITIDGGLSACSGWCSSQAAEDNVTYSCSYAGASISSSATANPNLANALTALESALKALLAQLGQ